MHLELLFWVMILTAVSDVNLWTRVCLKTTPHVFKGQNFKIENSSLFFMSISHTHGWHKMKVNLFFHAGSMTIYIFIFSSVSLFVFITIVPFYRFTQHCLGTCGVQLQCAHALHFYTATMVQYFQFMCHQTYLDWKYMSMGRMNSPHIPFACFAPHYFLSVALHVAF